VERFRAKTSRVKAADQYQKLGDQYAREALLELKDLPLSSSECSSLFAAN